MQAGFKFFESHFNLNRNLQDWNTQTPLISAGATDRQGVKLKTSAVSMSIRGVNPWRLSVPIFTVLI
jgi:hypothetical protein